MFQNVMLGYEGFVVPEEVLRRPILHTRERNYLTSAGPVKQLYHSKLLLYAQSQLLRRFCNDAPKKGSETL